MRKSRRLQKINNEREKKICKSNEKIYSDMIVYLRGADITEYNKELVREDLIQMIIDGQNRGDDIQKVIGNNYKEICDEIIEVMPKRTTFQKIMNGVEISISAIWILGLISIVKLLITSFITNDESFRFILSIGDIINMLIIILVANIVTIYICKTSFKEKNENEIVSFIKTWVVCMGIIGFMVMLSYYVDYTIVNIPMILAGIIVGIIFILDRIVSRYIE